MTAFRIHRPLMREPRWFLPGQGPGDAPPVGALDWLQDAGSLTQRLRAACGGVFSVHVRRQEWSRGYPGEAKLLGIKPFRAALVREVELRCNGRAWVFARTLIPISSLRGAARRLKMLGNRPLGAVLFADPSLTRGETQFVYLTPGQSLFESAVAGLSAKPDGLWGRRTLFHLAGKPLLVNEIFLPGIPPDKEVGHAEP
ncbi:MAG: chorismate lyase [Gammaproteobacteria bacterium]|nr:chorismate lyase [Gammaproteobacteria bacterium]MBU1655872.1 chorismate lyase [Gammaproteobacteria bacterium]MBU1960615.1 chorismate lyase [Gammaproteobacteria bacterium]